jgi:hypothetical protein
LSFNSPKPLRGLDALSEREVVECVKGSVIRPRGLGWSVSGGSKNAHEIRKGMRPSGVVGQHGGESGADRDDGGRKKQCNGRRKKK